MGGAVNSLLFGALLWTVLATATGTAYCAQIDYHQDLGVAKSATQEEIKAAYRKLSKLYHPDHLPAIAAEKGLNEDQASQLLREMTAKFQVIQSAYANLSKAGGGGSAGSTGSAGAAPTEAKPKQTRSVSFEEWIRILRFEDPQTRYSRLNRLLLDEGGVEELIEKLISSHLMDQSLDVDDIFFVLNEVTSGKLGEIRQAPTRSKVLDVALQRWMSPFRLSMDPAGMAARAHELTALLLERTDTEEAYQLLFKMSQRKSVYSRSLGPAEWKAAEELTLRLLREMKERHPGFQPGKPVRMSFLNCALKFVGIRPD